MITLLLITHLLMPAHPGYLAGGTPTYVASGCKPYPALGEMCSTPAARPRRHHRPGPGHVTYTEAHRHPLMRVYSTRKGL
jgi:hypothetical protein